jgi:hypothetical protein
VAIWYILPRFGILCQEKSGNPGLGSFGNFLFIYERVNLHVDRAPETGCGRVARWWIFIPKHPILKYFGRNILTSFMTIWYTLWSSALFYSNLVILWSFVLYSQFWYSKSMLLSKV